MRIVRLDVEPIWVTWPPGTEHLAADPTPANTGTAAVEGRIVLNRFETRVWLAWRWVANQWYERVVWRVGRIRCRVLHQHNVSCRGRSDHDWGHLPGLNGCGHWR